MNIEIKIDNGTCIKCGRCVAVCPAKIFIQKEERSVPKTRNVKTCIVCGHCPSVCPTDSVLHSEFPEGKVHRIDKGLMPSAEQTMLLLKKRRSRRVFKDAQVPEESFAKIIEAANTAPTAKNLQQLEYILVTDPAKLEELEKLTVDIFYNSAKKLSNPIIGFFVKRFAPETYKAGPMLEALKRSFDKGGRPILRGAKALLLIKAPKASMFGCEDANLAYQNASLMAESLNVAQFYTGYVMMAIRMDKEKRIKKLLGAKGKIHAGMAMGVPSIDYPNYADRRAAKLKHI